MNRREGAVRTPAFWPAPAERSFGPVAGDVDRIAAQLDDWLVVGGRLLLLADFDGTLTPIVPDPDDAWLSPGVRDDLDTLVRVPGVQVGIISGRDLGDVRERVAVSEVIYAGSHGLDIEGPDLRFVHPEAEAQREGLVAIGVTLSLRAANVPGLRVEPKRFGVALHYRHVATDQRRRVEMELARAIQQEGGRLRVFHGTKVLEIQPQAPWGKRECALWIESAVRGASSAPLMVVYMGDDWTDEIVFEALSGQAMTIRVGDGAPASRASYLLPDVADAQRLLARLADLTRSRG